MMMNDQYDWDRDARFDRLVDGDLTGEAYRDFLCELDNDPDGWRRCAMSFLEAQALGHEFHVLREELDIAPKVIASCKSVHPADKLKWLVLAMAASFLVALGIRALWRGEPSSSADSDLNLITAEKRDDGARMELPRPTELAVSNESIPPDELTFVVDRGDGEREQFAMPLYAGDDAAARWVMARSSMPDDVERKLRRAGYRVETVREWTPVRLRDGRRALFPIDELIITPISNRAF